MLRLPDELDELLFSQDRGLVLLGCLPHTCGEGLVVKAPHVQESLVVGNQGFWTSQDFQSHVEKVKSVLLELGRYGSHET